MLASSSSSPGPCRVPMRVRVRTPKTIIRPTVGLMLSPEVSMLDILAKALACRYAGGHKDAHMNRCAGCIAGQLYRWASVSLYSATGASWLQPRAVFFVHNGDQQTARARAGTTRCSDRQRCWYCADAWATGEGAADAQ